MRYIPNLNIEPLASQGPRVNPVIDNAGTAPLPVDALYRDHHHWLVDWLRARLGNEADAADLAQDTFLRIVARKRAADISPLREPRKYLATIAKGLVVDHWRRRNLEQAYLAALAAQPEPVAPSSEQRLLILETLTRLLNMLESLPAKPRQAFMLAQFDGLTYAEIAGRLKVSERMVCKYMSQAMLQCLLLDQQDECVAERGAPHV